MVSRSMDNLKKEKQEIISQRNQSEITEYREKSLFKTDTKKILLLKEQQLAPKLTSQPQNGTLSI